MRLDIKPCMKGVFHWLLRPALGNKQLFSQWENLLALLL